VRSSDSQAYEEGEVIETEGRALVPIEHVRPSPFRVRLVLDLAALRKLDAEAKKTTTVEPVVVWESLEERRRYVVLEGEWRRRVALRAGLKWLPVRVRRVRDLRDAEAQTLVAELRGFDAAPVSEGEAYARLLALGMSQAEVARAVHKEKSGISFRLRLTKLPEPVRELINTGRLNAKQGQELFRFMGRPEVFEGLVERAVKEGLSGNAIARMKVGEDGRNPPTVHAPQER
jgi:ParB family transcriptional regulator, chromosome partitioning protein